MSTSVIEPRATKVEFRADSMWVELADGRTIGVPLVYFPRLLAANDEERGRFVISGGGTGLHWEDIDEDIAVRNLFFGIGDRSRPQAGAQREAS